MLIKISREESVCAPKERVKPHSLPSPPQIPQSSRTLPSQSHSPSAMPSPPHSPHSSISAPPLQSPLQSYSPTQSSTSSQMPSLSTSSHPGAHPLSLRSLSNPCPFVSDNTTSPRQMLLGKFPDK